MCWPAPVTSAAAWTHAAFAGRADPVLAAPVAAVAHLGIDEHRRGRPRWRADEDSGEYMLLADRWHTCFFDLSGDQGLLGQVEGRTADDAAYWMWQAGPRWRDGVEIAAIDMCSIYASAVRRMLPGAGHIEAVAQLRRGPCQVGYSTHIAHDVITRSGHLAMFRAQIGG
jgi:hypothetical protein